jgi:hypothetical protein
MRFKITTDSEVNFVRQLLIHLVGMLELHRCGILTYQDLCDFMYGLYPKNKLTCFKLSKNVKKILGLFSEIDTVKSEFPHIYSKSLDQIYSLVKDVLEKLPDSEYDEDGHFRWQVECIDQDENVRGST